MKRWLIITLMMFIFCAPALAQTAPADPAAYLPSSAAAYLEIRADADARNAYSQLASLGSQLSGTTLPPSLSTVDTVIDAALGAIFPGLDFATDIHPWLGDRIGISAPTLSTGTSTTAPDFVACASGERSGGSAGLRDAGHRWRCAG